MIKKGDRGYNVGNWQEFLVNMGYLYSVDGIFGKLTEQATINFQNDNDLVADGIVGKKTYAKAYSLGYLTTDLSVDKDSQIFQKNFMRSNEYMKSDGKKDWVYIHHTAGWENPFQTIRDWENDNRGEVGTEFVIGGQKITDSDATYDGVILQSFPEGNFGWHLGIGNNYMHRNSVGIELCNFGWIKNGKTYVGTIPDENQIVTLKEEFRGFKQWHRYSDNQIINLKNLLEFISERDSIDIRKGLPELIRDKGVKAFDVCNISMCNSTKGLWNHTNVSRHKWDMFPQQELIDMLLSL